MISLQLQDISVRHGKKQVLSAVDAPAFTAGQVVALIGPNAAGKSSLFRRIAGLLPGEGQARISAADQFRTDVCYMPQAIYGDAEITVYDSLVLARKQNSSWRVSDEDHAIISDTLEQLNLSKLAFLKVHQLSGGQRQMIGLAQSLVRDAGVLLLDEPTSALDLHRELQVLDFIRNYTAATGRITLVAIHNLNLAMRFADQVIVLANRTLHSSGPVNRVITPELLRDVFQIEARIEQCSKALPQIMVDRCAAYE